MKILKVKCLAPTRLDNYLTQQYPALTPGRLNKALRENKIKLNGKKQPLSTRVMAGDEIKLFILDDVLDADRRVEGPAWKNARTPAQVVYDCPQILIVNKPAGVAVDGPEDDTLLHRALLEGLGVVRTQESMERALHTVQSLSGNLALLGQAVLRSALARRESRGAQFRADIPRQNTNTVRRRWRTISREIFLSRGVM